MERSHSTLMNAARADLSGHKGHRSQDSGDAHALFSYRGIPFYEGDNMTRKTAVETQKPAALPAGYAGIHSSIVKLLDASRQAAAHSVNALMTASYWEIGRRIVDAEQQGKRRAGYGEQLMARLSADLTQQFGRGFGVNNLENMRRFFLAHPHSKISQTLSGKLDSDLALDQSLAVPRSLNLTALAQVFPLPWSAYVRLLSAMRWHDMPWRGSQRR